jgi:hypothetical protein
VRAVRGKTAVRAEIVLEVRRAETVETSVRANSSESRDNREGRNSIERE